MMNTYFDKIKPFLYLGIFYTILSFILRIIFVFHPITTATFGLDEIIKIFGIGLLAIWLWLLYYAEWSSGRVEAPEFCEQMNKRVGRDYGNFGRKTINYMS